MSRIPEHISAYSPEQFIESFRRECIAEARQYVKDNPKRIYYLEDMENVLRNHYKMERYSDDWFDRPATDMYDEIFDMIVKIYEGD